MSQGQDSAQEKSLAASPRKLEQARRKGDMPRSVDAQAAAAYLGLAVAGLMVGGGAFIGLGEALIGFIAHPEDLAAQFLNVSGAGIAVATASQIMDSVYVVFVGPAALILTLLAAQKSIVFAPEKILPKISRINPVENAKQKYGPNGLFEFAKSALKLTAVATIMGWVLWSEFGQLSGYVYADARSIVDVLGDQFWTVLVCVLIYALVVAAADVMWQRHSFLKRMRMTQQEMKDETKQSEGDPHMRASRRQRGREIANNRMLHDVAKADVVITNPTHYAVALTWSRAQGAVPICVAKGEDELALRIRTKAEQCGVPIHPDAPTARSIYATVDVGRMIEPDHYKAVAAAIVFADKLRARARERDGGGTA